MFDYKVYAAQPREGTETLGIWAPSPCSMHWFMQLNPARGRKQVPGDEYLCDEMYAVYAAQPREGTETCGWHSRCV